MNAPFAQPASFQDERYQHDITLKNRRLGLLLWRFANGGIFVFFMFANLLMRNTQPVWPPKGVARLDIVIPAVISIALLISWVTSIRIRPAIRNNNPTGMRTGILLTIGLGLIFFIGILVVCTQIPYSGMYSSIALTMNAFHALHAGVGILLLGYVFRKAGQGVYTKEEHWTVEASVVFWQFVVLMWVFFFAVLYIL